MTRRRSGALLAATLALVALGCFVASLLTVPQRGSLQSSGRRGPVAAGFGREAALPLPSWLGGAPRQGTMAVRLSFVDRRPSNGQVLLRAGDARSGIEVSVAGPIEHAWYAKVRLVPWPGGKLEAVLVPRLVAGRRYDLRLSVRDCRQVAAFVNGREAFSYGATTPTVTTLFNPLVAGAPSGQGRGALRGAVATRRLELTYASFAAPGSPAVSLTLRTAAALLAAAALAVAVAELVSASSLLGERRSSGALRRLVGRLSSRALVGGLVLLVAGGALLELVTPPADAVVTRVGSSSAVLGGVRAGGEARELLPGASGRGLATSSVDTTLSFELRVDRLPGRGSRERVVSTRTGRTGIAVGLDHAGVLAASVPLFAVQSPGGFPLAEPVPLGTWTRVEIKVVRSRFLEAFVDGRQVYGYTYSSPVWGAAPTGVVAGTRGSGIAVRDLSSATTLFARPAPATSVLLVRLAQVLGFLLVAAGAVVLAHRLLGRLVAKAVPRRPLVVATFGVAGLGIVANLLVDALHVQRPPAPFVPRGTWLFASDARFSDFLQTFEMLKSLRPYGTQAGSYPPVGYFLLGPFAPMSQYAALLAFLALFVGALCWWLWRSFAGGGGLLGGLGMLAVALASYPVSFAIDRANVDLVVLFLLLLGLAAIEQGRDGLAAPLIGLAAAAKIFPALYGLLFLPGRRWRYAVAAAASAGVATLFCFLGLAGSLSSQIAGLRRGLGLVKLSYANGVESTLSSVTISSWFQSIGYAIGGAPAARAVEAVTSRLVLPEEVLGTLVLAWYLTRRERSPWRAVTLVTVAVLVLPQVSYGYDLLYLLAPLALFVREAPVERGTLRLAVLFGLLLAPKAYLYLGSSFIDSSTLLSAPLLVALAVAVVRDGRAERRAVERGRPAESPARAIAFAPAVDPGASGAEP